MTDRELLPCPFCGAGTTEIRENGRPWLGTRYGDPSSVSVRHWCEPIEGQPSRMIERVGRDRAAAVAAWNMRTTDANLAALQAEIEALRAEVEEMQRRLDREESDHARTIDQRDAAEDALGRMFQAVTGRTAEWSSAWGYVDAIEEVEEHVATLATERDQLAAALEAAREDACVALVADIRFACGDNGKRSQPELVEYIRGLARDAARYRWLRDREIPEWLDLWHQNPDRIDAAIDAALRERLEKGMEQKA